MAIVLESSLLLFAGVFLFGTLIGSFLNVVIFRVPRILEFEWRCQCHELLGTEETDANRPAGIVATRSQCPYCNHQIGVWENIPLLSFLILRGQCSSCKKRISLRYPLVELTTGVLFVVCIWSFGASLQGVTALLFTSFLIALTGIDIDHQLLPDNMTVPLMWAGIFLAIWSVHSELLASVIGAMAGYLVLWIIYHLFRILTGKEGMGYGDFKLLAAIGAWLGWEILPLVILISSVVGALWGFLLILAGKLEKDSPMPFGPFIAAAGWIALISGERLYDLYLRTGMFG